MRNEIKQRIENSGTGDDTQIIKDYKSALRSIGVSEQELEEMVIDKETVYNLKNQVILDTLNIQDDEMEEIARMIFEEKPNTVQISLAYNHITDKGAIVLARLCSSLSSLSYLNLQSNAIGGEGLLALYELSVSKPTLGLTLQGNKPPKVNTVEEIKWEAKRKYEEGKNQATTTEERPSHKHRHK